MSPIQGEGKNQRAGIVSKRLENVALNLVRQKGPMIRFGPDHLLIIASFLPVAGGSFKQSFLMFLPGLMKGEILRKTIKILFPLVKNA